MKSTPNAPIRYVLVMDKQDKTVLLRSTAATLKRVTPKDADPAVYARVLAARDALKAAHPCGLVIHKTVSVALPDQEALNGLRLVLELGRIGDGDVCRTLRYARILEAIATELDRSVPDQLADLDKKAPRLIAPAEDEEEIASNRPKKETRTRAWREEHAARKKLQALAKPGDGLAMIERTSAALRALGLDPKGLTLGPAKP